MKARDPARETALRLLHQLEAADVSLDRLLVELDAGLPDARDRRFARQLVMGSVRWRARLDWIVDRFARRPISSAWARQILRLGAYQILWLDRVPARAAVHTSVDLAKRYGHGGIAGLVNAILRQILCRGETVEYPPRNEGPGAYLAVYHSHPRWLVERWLARWGEATTEGMLQANNASASLYIRLNSLRATGDELVDALEAEGRAAAPAGPLPGCFSVEEAGGLFDSPAWRAGLFQVQDVNAGLAVALLDPQPGERVLDVCSAPGGKSTQMAFAMRDRGLVVAADRSFRRVRRVRQNACRLGLRRLRAIAQDACSQGTSDFDRILADVPCSGTGTLGRRPDIRWRRRAEELPGLASRQQAILARAFTRLRVGGILVYSTCSLEHEENAGVVERFLAATRNAVLEPAGGPFPGRSWSGDYLETLPGREPGDGSFAARIRKAGSGG